MRAIMLAIVCLCAYFAVGQDADPAFCDTLDGIMSEVGDYSYYTVVINGELVSKHEIMGDDNRFSVIQDSDPIKLPGATSCVAMMLGWYTIVYTCQWMTKKPRSTFVSMGGGVVSCLGKRGFSSYVVSGENENGPAIPGAKTSDGGRRFSLRMFKQISSSQVNMDYTYAQVSLFTYKVPTKGTFLCISFYQNDEEYSKRFSWLKHYAAEAKSGEYSDNNPLGLQSNVKAALIWTELSDFHYRDTIPSFFR